MIVRLSVVFFIVLSQVVNIEHANQYESYGTAWGHLNKWSDEDVWDMIVKNERREDNPNDGTRNLHPKNQIAGDHSTLNRLSDNSI